jgi:hypothetical protein
MGRSLSSEHMARIAAGVRREVAVSRALRSTMPEDWSIRHASPEEDAVGIDIIVTDETGREYYVDVKTAGGYVGSVDRLQEKGRLTGNQAHEALDNGYVEIGVGRRQDITACMFDADRLGAIVDHEFEDPGRVYEFIRERMATPKSNI